MQQGRLWAQRDDRVVCKTSKFQLTLEPATALQAAAPNAYWGGAVPVAAL